MTDVLVNDAYIPFLEAGQRLQIFYGGSSSGKSFFLAQRAVLDSLKGANHLVCRNVANTIRISVFNEIQKAIFAMGLAEHYQINRSDMRITCTLNGSQILFAGLDDVEKLKSITPTKGVLERVWIEEATEIPREAFMQLKKRLRGRSDKKKFIVMSFNPIIKTHWIYKDFFGRWDDSANLLEDENQLILKTTYKDNQFLEPDDIYELENEKDIYYRDVYTYGNWGVLGNLIFRNWRTEDLSAKRGSFDNIYNGMDFGFSSDPTALIRCHYDRKNKQVYIFDEHYQTGMHNDERINMLRKKAPNEYITCDSASPELIDDLVRNGIRAIPARKGPGSIQAGIDFLQRHEIIIDTNCQNFKNELSTYHWDEDKYGTALQRPVDRDNHGIDALRMALESVMQSQGTGAAGRF